MDVNYNFSKFLHFLGYLVFLTFFISLVFNTLHPAETNIPAIAIKDVMENSDFNNAGKMY